MSRLLAFLAVIAIAATGAGVALASSAGHSRPAAARAALAAPRATSGKPIVGLSDGVAGYGGASTAAKLSQIERATHTKWLRDTFYWSRIEPRKGHFSWGYYDHYMLTVARRHLRVVAQLVGAPRWSGPNAFSVPANPAQYARYAAAVLKRYGVKGTFWRAHPGLRGSAITVVELWNEPYYDNGNAGHYDPARYARLVRATWKSVHRVDPSAKLLLEAEMAAHHYHLWRWWVDSLYQAVPDLNRYFSAVSAHAYGTNATQLSPIKPDEPYPNDLKVRRIEDLRRQFVRHHAGRKPFWLTEIGFSTCHGDARVCMTPAKQKANLIAVNKFLHGRWSRFVQGALVYRFADSVPATSVQGGYGLTTLAGRPKPALAVFRAMASASPR